LRQIKKIFILLPGFNNDSPVKGAAALANELSKKYQVVVVSLKTPNSEVKLRDSINLKFIDLGNFSWLNKFSAYKKIITENYKTKSNISISFCFSADIINSFCSKYAQTGSSIRANLYQNYKHSYGFFGFFLAKINFIRLKKINKIFAMTESMAKQIKHETGIDSHIVGNFLDEEQVEIYRRKYSNQGPYRYVFTGSLSTRKKVETLINAIKKLNNDGHDVRCDILGDGPLKNQLHKRIEDLKISKIIKLHGNVSNPFKILANADVFVLPSLSEGLSRSSMEALYLGIPCVLRNIDGNSELIEEGINGKLFIEDTSISKLMLECAELSREKNLYQNIILKDNFRQSTGSAKIEELITTN
jgi:glycosyltransferase involved in cell wall biosynthesis